MATEWINLYDPDTGEQDSSWIRSVGWNDGTLIIRRFDNNPEDPTTVRYEDLDYELFEDLREIYENGGSVGSALNERVLRNKDVDPAKKL